MKSLLSVNADAKTVKGRKLGFLTGILYLAPLMIAGCKNVCPFASPGCTKACLYSAGRGRFTNVQSARIAKTKRFFDNRGTFLAGLVWSIEALVRKAKRESLTPCVRLNGTSDLPWESFLVSRDGFGLANLMSAFPKVQFYDYTKSSRRAMQHATGTAWPTNYHLTFSRSETNNDDCRAVLLAGGNVAVVFRDSSLPDSAFGFPVFSADESDLRFLDAGPGVAGLVAKGQAKRDASGFVVDTFSARYERGLDAAMRVAGPGEITPDPDVSSNVVLTGQALETYISHRFKK